MSYPSTLLLLHSHYVRVVLTFSLCVLAVKMQSKREISRATSFWNCLKACLLHQLQVSSIELSLLAEFCRQRKVFSLQFSGKRPKIQISNSFCHIIVTLPDFPDMDTIIKSHVRVSKGRVPIMRHTQLKKKRSPVQCQFEKKLIFVQYFFDPETQSRSIKLFFVIPYNM